MKRDLVTFKGNREGLVVYCDDTALWNDIVDNLSLRLNGKEGLFFEGSSVVIDVGERRLSPEQVSSLWKLFLENGVNIKSLLVHDPQSETGISQGNPIRQKELPETDSMSKLPTLSVRRNLRSGQDVTCPGNVIVFGDVNPGAEISAVGSILVLGDLRGTVHAGVAGDNTAWVAALRLQPMQLRIGDTITCAPDEEPRVPEVAKIQDGMIVVESIKDLQMTMVNRRS